MSEKFKYRAVNSTGTISEGTIDAKSELDAIELLRTKGIKPIKVEKEEEKSSDINILSSQKFSLKELILFCRQTSTMLNAGMALNKCLDVFASQSDSKKVKGIVFEVAKSIQKGETFYQSMDAQGTSFPKLMLKTVEAGESTGKLGEVIEKMATHYEKEKKIRAKIKGAMMYPIVLSIVSFISVTILLVGVMPKFISIFSSSGVEFPALTKFVISLSNILTRYGLVLIIIVAIIILCIKRIFQIPSVRLDFDRAKLKVKFIKGPIRKIVTARFTRTLATMLSSGIAVVPAIIAAGENVQNTFVEEKMKLVALGIEKGMGLTEQLEKSQIFPPMMLSMIGIGEESGKLTDMLEKTADFYDEELEAALQQLVSLIEPVMIVIMALLIGTIVVAMYLPMFDSFKTMK
ncbi:MAG: type II secretion system F family protein [Filifactoraceae bacterium]